MIAENRLSELSGERLPPHSRDAERSVLGSVLRLNAVLHDVLAIVSPGDFYLDAHQRIFSAMSDMADQAKVIDLVTLAEEIRRRGMVEDIGGLAYLADLWDSSPTAANAEYYARIVRSRAVARSLIRAGTAIIRDAYQPGAPAEEILEAAEKSIYGIAEESAPADTSTLDAHMKEVWDRFDGKIVERFLPSGLEALDSLIGGFKAGQLSLIAARPSHGKTSLAVTLAVHFLRLKAPVFFVSLEESGVGVAQRILSVASSVPLTRIATGRGTPEEIKRMIVADQAIPKGLLHTAESSVQTVQKIAANARRLKRRHGIQAVIIDYVQLITARDRKPARHEQVAEISRGLKVMARDLNIPVIALAQLNRGPEERNDHRPRMSDLRESGSLEADADMGILLHRPEMYNPEDRPGIIEVIVDKQRLGPRGTAQLMYTAECMRLEDKPQDPLDFHTRV